MKLFLKIFLWFWMTVTVTGITIALTFMFQRGAVPVKWHQMMEHSARYMGSAAVTEMDRGGPKAVADYIRQLGRAGRLQACLFDAGGAPIGGEDCSSFREMAQRAAASKAPDSGMRSGIARTAMLLRGADGREYIFATELPAGPAAAFGADRFSFAAEWGVALLVSGLICYSLTRYLTGPILRLRDASRQLASGELSTRAALGMEQRHDELGELVRDFNAMADRIEELISGQRQLIHDVSHELRSPLARLYVALDLVRERKGDDPALVHAEQDLKALSEMAERLLTVARLDTCAGTAPISPVNLEELVSAIVRDAEFEWRRSDGQIRLTAESGFWVNGNAELLHSAIENVIRNAVRYTDEGTPVDVRIEPDDAHVRLVVRDYGPGIPAAEVGNIFRPFYRVTTARDRESGGVGLGLAIADKVIRLHHGTIRASNAAPHGLEVEIRLPRLASSAPGSDHPQWGPG